MKRTMIIAAGALSIAFASLLRGAEATENPKAIRYQHPACSYIKLDLEFELAAPDDRKDDKITKRSEPLLDLVPKRAQW